MRDTIQIVTRNITDNQAANVQYSATGYAINRVRYDVSLVHDEWEHPEATDNPPEAMIDPDYIEPVYEVIYD